jgi:hypothetical protein
MTLLQEGSQYLSYKHHWSDQRKSILLVVGPVSLDQKDPGSFASFIVRIFCVFQLISIIVDPLWFQLVSGYRIFD